MAREKAHVSETYVEASVLGLARAFVNGGRRGYLVGIDPAVFAGKLGARTVECALTPE